MSRVKTVAPEQVGAEILEHLAISGEDSLVLIEGDDFVLVKKARPTPLERFEALAAETRERFERLGIGEQDVEQAIRWARGSS